MALSCSMCSIRPLHCTGGRVEVNPRFVQISSNGHDHFSSKLPLRFTLEDQMICSTNTFKTCHFLFYSGKKMNKISFPLDSDYDHFPVSGQSRLSPGDQGVTTHVSVVSGHTGHNLSSSGRFLRRSLMLPYQAATTKQISFALLRKSMWRERRKS